VSLSLHDINPSRDKAASNHDAEIWSSLRTGEKKALSYFYTKYFNNLYNYGSKISRDAGMVEDCIQDLFVEFWNKREGLSDVTNVKYYLYKSLRRKIIYKRSLLSRLPLNEIDSFDIQLSHKSHYLNQQINSDMREEIKNLVNTLSVKQKEAIFLVYYEELSYEDAALIMELKIKTVYNLVHLAISKLRQNKGKLSSGTFFSILF